MNAQQALEAMKAGKRVARGRSGESFAIGESTIEDLPDVLIVWMLEQGSSMKCLIIDEAYFFRFKEDWHIAT